MDNGFFYPLLFKSLKRHCIITGVTFKKSFKKAINFTLTFNHNSSYYFPLSSILEERWNLNVDGDIAIVGVWKK